MKALIVFLSFLTISLSAQGAKLSSSNPINDCMKARYCIAVNIHKDRQRLYAFYNDPQVGYPILTGFSNGEFALEISSGKSNKTQRNLFEISKPSLTVTLANGSRSALFSVGEVAGRWRTSKKHNNAALYYAIQLEGHIFIHATSKANYGNLGIPASLGCIRTDLVAAETLNTIVRNVIDSGGHHKVRVVVTDNYDDFKEYD